MVKKLGKLLMMTMICSMIFVGNSYAADKSFSFTLANTGKRYINFSNNYNKKLYKNDAWTIDPTSITAYGAGISFCPAKYIDSKTKACTKSAMWVKKKGRQYGKYASGDSCLVNYKLGARQDDDFSTSFKATGKFNADKTK